MQGGTHRVNAPKPISRWFVDRFTPQHTLLRRPRRLAHRLGAGGRPCGRGAHAALHPAAEHVELREPAARRAGAGARASHQGYGNPLPYLNPNPEQLSLLHQTLLPTTLGLRRA